MPRGKRLTKEERQKILDLHNAGMKNSVIAHAVELNIDTVRYVIRSAKSDEMKYPLKWAENFRQEWDYWTTLVGGRRCG